MQLYQLFLLLSIMTSLALTFDPNMQQILSRDTLFYVSESTKPNTVVYVIPDSLHWTKKSYTYKKREGSSYFEVTGQGEVILAKPINFEVTNREKFVVNVYNNATDARVQKYFVTVTADVFDENEAAPVFLQNQKDEFNFDEIPEIGYLITTVSATDKDTADLDKLQFSVDSEFFKINKTSGELTVAKNLLPSRDKISNEDSPMSAYSLIVTVSDGKFETKKKFKVQLTSKTSQYDRRISPGEPYTQPPNVKTYTLSSQNGLELGIYVVVAYFWLDVCIPILMTFENFAAYSRMFQAFPIVL